MRPWRWVAILVIAGMIAASAWALLWRSARTARPTSRFALPGVAIKFTQVGEYAQDDYDVYAVCTSRGDLLYFAEGKVATSPGLTVIPDGCRDGRGGVAPTSGK